MLCIVSVQKFGKGFVCELEDFLQCYQDIIVDVGGCDFVELCVVMMKVEVLVLFVQVSQFDLWMLKVLDELVC